MDGIVIEVDDPLGTRSHAYSASPASCRIRQGSPLLVLIVGSERTLFRTSLAIGAALKAQDRVAAVPRPGMKGLPAFHAFNSLDGLYNGPCSVFHAILYALGGPDCAGCVYARPLRLVGKADEMRIGKAVLSFR